MNLREIDRLVAEKVMGWIPQREKQDRILYVLQDGTHVALGWNPTANISDAWQVVERLYKDKGLRMFVGLDFPPLYMARLKDDKGDWIGHGAEAETAPLAICLAALKAVGVDVE